MTHAARQRQLDRSDEMEERLSVIRGLEEHNGVLHALNEATERRASLVAESRGKLLERERCLAILRKYAAGSLTVKAIIKEIDV